MQKINVPNKTIDHAISLSKLLPGQQATLLSFNNIEVALRRKLLAMGLLPGCVIACVRHAPWGGPMQLCLRDTMLSIRRCDAHNISIKLSE